MLVPCRPGAGRDVDCMTLRLDMPWYLLAVRERDRHTAAWDQPASRTKMIEGYVHSANDIKGASDDVRSGK